MESGEWRVELGDGGTRGTGERGNGERGTGNEGTRERGTGETTSSGADAPPSPKGEGRDGETGENGGDDLFRPSGTFP